MTHSWEAILLFVIDVIIIYGDYDIYDDDYDDNYDDDDYDYDDDYDDDNEVTLAETHFGAYHRPPDGQF